MSRKFRPGLRSALFIVVLALVAVGCGEKEPEDPYVYGTLDQVTRGGVISKDFLYEFDTPEFVFAKGNTALVRSGNHIEVLVGDDIENRAPTLDGKIIGARKFFTPYVYLMATRIKSGIGENVTITELDSIPDPLLPHFTQVQLEEVQGFDISALQYNKKKEIDDMLDAEVQTVGTLHQMPDHTWEAPEGADPDSVQAPMAWYLKAEKNDSTFKITNVTPSLELAFEILQAQDLPFIGGIKIGEAYPWASRRENRVSAPIEVQYVKYANRYMAP
jgi:hypothetical protein